MTFVREANSAAYRSMSRAVDRERRDREEPRPADLAREVLSSIVTPLHGTALCISPSTSSRGSESRRRSESGRSSRRSPPARWRPATSRSTSTTRTSRSCRARRSCSRWPSVRSCSRCSSGGSRRGGRERRPAAMLGGVALALGALFFAGSLVRDHYVAWPGSSAGCCARRSASRPRARCWRASARGSTGEAALLPVFAEGSALLARGAVGARAAGRR